MTPSFLKVKLSLLKVHGIGHKRSQHSKPNNVGSCWRLLALVVWCMQTNNNNNNNLYLSVKAKIAVTEPLNGDTISEIYIYIYQYIYERNNYQHCLRMLVILALLVQVRKVIGQRPFSRNSGLGGRFLSLFFFTRKF